MVHSSYSTEQLIEILKPMSWEQIKQFSSENPGLLTLEEESESRSYSVLQQVIRWFTTTEDATRAKA
ncbi:hypothetical protein [Ammoniphilus sp. YIM 78166]|uniref:hypothetical protein n=1 Tax=Ammoniphilus sp. YIM 78166 TaxID=1644106 RepID=UPI00106F625A|nr:hypothetical protein [Ammoniphilus sp. YIM 78166]